ncbi:MAG: hypothetical protein ACTHNW_15755, partial [Mucilaginibacter sp.]
PNSFRELKIIDFKIEDYYSVDSEEFEDFISRIGDSDTHENIYSESNDQKKVELLVLPSQVKSKYYTFGEVINSTNAYLYKNKGSAADLNILQDICERHLQRLENEVNNLINLPLYIGLGGTFIGIIFGLSHVDFNSANGLISTNSIQGLLNGVVLAMVASLTGLALTVINTSVNYRPAVSKNEVDKNQYYDFIQRELLPVLNLGVSGSLSNFKSVLDHFIQKFGENIEDYGDSARLLNDNLGKQQIVLQEINKLGITETSKQIVQVFADLKSSSEHLDTFKQYQTSLNDNIKLTAQTVSDFNTIIGNFKDFNTNLLAISTNVLNGSELQKQFKDSLEIHFPTINDHKEIWRKNVDELNADISEVYKTLNGYFKKSSQLIENFIGENENFFIGLNEIKNSIKIFVENSNTQNEQFRALRTDIIEMRNDFKESQKASLELNLQLIETIKDFNIKLTKTTLTASTEN